MNQRIYDCRPAPERDDTVRGRLPAQEQLERDARVARLLRFHTYREVAARLGCSVGAVQRSVQRNAKRRDEIRARQREAVTS